MTTTGFYFADVPGIRPLGASAWKRAAKTSSDGYPPYNIEQTGPNGLRITLAVAGFTMTDLQITQEDNQLVIRGRQADEAQDRVYLHRGIAARQFQRAFVLAEGIEVKGAPGSTTGCCTSTLPGRSRRFGSRRSRSPSQGSANGPVVDGDSRPRLVPERRAGFRRSWLFTGLRHVSRWPASLSIRIVGDRTPNFSPG